MLSRDELASYFDGVELNNNGGFRCLCPIHNDHSPSLEWNVGRKGWVCHCLACDAGFDEIVAAKGIDKRLLFKDSGDGKSGEAKKRWSKTQYGYRCHCQDFYEYYRIDNGEYSHVKFRMPPKKEGRKYMPQGYDKEVEKGKDPEWVPNLEGIDTSLSVFSNVSIEKLKKMAADGETLYYCEGEKDCKTLKKYGLAAFTLGSSGDAKAIKKGSDGNKGEVFKYLRGAELVIFEDNDKDGIESAHIIKSHFETLGGKASIVHFGDMPPNSDVSDFMEKATKEELFERIEKARKEVPAHEDDVEKPLREKEVYEDELGDVGDLGKFHNAENGRITSVNHNAVYEYIKTHVHLFVWGQVPYIYSNGVYKADVSGARLKSMIKRCIYPWLIKANTINSIYQLFLQDYELEVTDDDVNNYPIHWIPFSDCMYDAKTGETIPHNPAYRCINMIPYSRPNMATATGENIEAFLEYICEDEEDRQMVLEYMGYCLTRDMSQQKFLILSGVAGSGKSILVRLFETLIGRENISNISLEDFGKRFVSAGLVGKVLNSCSDADVSILEEEATGKIKAILGQDTMRCEFKGKDSFSCRPYAKLIFSVNELPLIKNEKSNGFFRRVLVLKVNKTPSQIDVDLFQKLTQPNEIEYLLKLAVEALGMMYKRKTILESSNSKRAVAQMRIDSDTVQGFLLECCSMDDEGRGVERGALFSAYEQYCRENKRTSLKKTSFYKSLRTKGIKDYKSNVNYFKGISLKAEKLGSSSLKNSHEVPKNGEKVPTNAVLVEGIDVPDEFTYIV